MWISSLNDINTSPDHGTASDSAGKGIATHGSIVSAMELAITLAQNRQNVKRISPMTCLIWRRFYVECS